LLAEGFEIGHFFAAGRAPGGPEIEQDYFAAEVGEGPGFAVEICEGEGGGGADEVVGFELVSCGFELGDFQIGGGVFVANQTRQFEIRLRRFAFVVR
jgi:hypothetical protein